MVQFGAMTSNSGKPPAPSATQAHRPHGLPPEVDALLVYAAQRRLLLPMLLFVTAHRPLGFVVGQFLFAAQPLTLLFPSLNLRMWAETLSDVDGVQRVEERLLAVGKKKFGDAGTRP